MRQGWHFQVCKLHLDLTIRCVFCWCFEKHPKKVILWVIYRYIYIYAQRPHQGLPFLNTRLYIYICPPPPKIYLFDVWHELIHKIYPLLSCLKWILTWTPIQISHTNNTHEPHTFSYPKWTYCLICITQPLTRHMKEVDTLINNTKWLQRYVDKWMDEK